jgi:hypothetical protein
MQEHIHWSSGPLTIPYTSIMLNYITCGRMQTNCEIVAVDSIQFAFFCIIIITHNALSVAYKVCVFEWSLYSHLPATKVHSRVCIVATPARSLITILFGLIQGNNDKAISYLLAASCIVYQSLLGFFFWYEQPFVKRHINEVHVGIYAVACMGSFSVLFSIISQGTGDVVCLGMFFIGTLLLIPSILKLNDMRISFARDAPLSSLKTPTDVEIRIRLELQKLVATKIARENGDLDDTGTLDTKEIENIISHFQKSMKQSFKFNLIWATYLFMFKSNKFVAMHKLRNNLNNSPMIFDILPLQIRLRSFAESSSTEEVEAGLTSFEEQQRLQRHAVDCMSRALSLQARFWGTLISDDYTLQSLEALTSQIHFVSEAARQSLQRIVFLNPKSPIVPAIVQPVLG